MDISWQTLPNEVLWLIFTGVENRSDLVQLQLVCKHWSYLAYQRLYHTASIDQTPLLRPYTETLEHSTTPYQPHLLVMAIDLGDYFPTQCYSRSERYKTFVHAVARLCPHITRIKAGLKAPSKSFYRDVRSLHQEGYFQHMEQLPDYSYAEAYESESEYYRLVVAMKASLTHVSIAKHPFSSKALWDERFETNMWQQLRAFPRLEQLNVSYRNEGFLHEADAFITKCVAPTVSIHAHLTGFSHHLARQPLDFDAVIPQPQVKHLEIDIFCFNFKDLTYIMRKFTGLELFSAKNMQDQKVAPMMIHLEEGGSNDGSLVDHYLKTFRYLVSLKRFKVSRLWFPKFNTELFAFWAEHPQLTAITFSKCLRYEAEAAYMTVMTRNSRETGFKLADFQDKNTKDGACEMELAFNHFNFSLYYSQALELFKGSTIESMCLRDITAATPAESEDRDDERRKTVGNSLGYIIDHYTALKDIQLHQVNCRTFKAHAVERQLQSLTFEECRLSPHVLQQLSRSLILYEVVMVHADRQNHSLVIDMPQTAIGDMRVINYSTGLYLVKLCVSEPSPVTQYLQIQANDVVYMDQNTYDAMCLTTKYHYDCMAVHINCKTFKTFSTSDDRCFSLTT
ncbi:hypothetical protein MBANPS3_008797 [Mucor bainieri]